MTWLWAWAWERGVGVGEGRRAHGPHTLPLDSRIVR